MPWDPLAWMCLTSSPKRLKLQGLQGKAGIIKSTQYMISRCVECVGHSKDWGTPAAEGHAAYASVRNFPDDGHLRATGRISVGLFYPPWRLILGQPSVRGQQLPGPSQAEVRELGQAAAPQWPGRGLRILQSNPPTKGTLHLQISTSPGCFCCGSHESHA